MLHVAIEIQSDEWLAAWRPATNRLLVKALDAPRLNERMALRVKFRDQFTGATVMGTAVSVEHQHPPYRIEMAPDAEGMKAVQLLCAVARGEPVRFVLREPRYVVKLPVFVEWNGERMLTNIISISANGCALRWPGSVPALGQRLQLCIGSGSRAYDVRGVVRWLDPGGGKMGLRIFGVNGARQAWDSLLGEAARTGATVI